jgi:hypothetical protein
MTAWNRLRSLADRVLAGDDGRLRADDAIYLSDNAYRERRAGAPAAPKIRERHFGLGLRRERQEAGVQPSRPGLLARRGLRRATAAPGDAFYAGTKIVGTPARPQAAPEPRKTATEEPKRPALKISAPPPDAPELGKLGSVGIEEPKKPAPPPVPIATEPRNAAIDRPKRPAPEKPAPALAQAPAPRKAPIIRPAAEKPVDDETMLRHLFGEPEPAAKPNPAPVKSAPIESAPAKSAPEKPAPKKPAPAKTTAKPAKKKKKMDRGDATIATLGVLLAVTCAAFPWYIFFNQEQFGVREFVFNGGGSARPSAVAFVPQPVGKPFAATDVPKLELDFFPTATLPADREPARAVPASEQPFPSDRVNFRLVHVANGRAMIEDADGLWVVQRGSRLPDASRVVAIEQRGASWVLVTSNDRIVKLQPD